MEKFELTVLGRTHEYEVRVVNGVPVILGPGVSLEGVDLTGENLSGLDLSHTNFRGASLAFTQCRGTRFEFANFEGANCTGIDARDALMRGVSTDPDTNWLWADVRGADYDHRMIRGYVFDDELSPEYMERVGINPLTDDQRPPLGLIPVDLVNAITPDSPLTQDTDCARFETATIPVANVLDLEEMEHRVDVETDRGVTVGAPAGAEFA